jgi:hypothetical protein
MWIRSQDLAILVKANEICIENKTNIWAEGYLIGKYSTEEKALDVLDEIKDAIEDTFYYNIENLGCGSYALKKGCEIYQMPQDDEVGL